MTTGNRICFIWDGSQRTLFVDGIAYNSIAENDGTLIGDPVWQSEGGMEAGALEFDGIDDYISTDFVLNQAYSAFNVIAWIANIEPNRIVTV